MTINIKDKLTVSADLAEKAIESAFRNFTSDDVLSEAMAYAVLGGGKRIRAFLTLAFAEAFGGEIENALPFAAAIETVHAYSLVHDDLPCMDNDDMRRGKPSCHKQFDEATALLAGDALLTLAFEVCASNEAVVPQSRIRAVSELAKLSGVLGMCGGQNIDLNCSVSSYGDLLKLHKLKTGALICAACLLGYYSAKSEISDDEISAITKYAENLGIAFQIHDDILDVISDSATLGKPVGSDEKNEKKTVLHFMSLEEAIDEEKRVTDEALEALCHIPKNETLREFALWLLERKN